MYDLRDVVEERSATRAAGPEASDPRVTVLGAFTALPAPPRPVAMYCCGVMDGCGSTIEYFLENIVTQVFNGMIKYVFGRSYFVKYETSGIRQKQIQAYLISLLLHGKTLSGLNNKRNCSHDASWYETASRAVSIT